MAASEGRVAAGVLRRKALTRTPAGVQYSRRRARNGRRGDDRGGGQPQPAAGGGSNVLAFGSIIAIPPFGRTNGRPISTM